MDDRSSAAAQSTSTAENGRNPDHLSAVGARRADELLGRSEVVAAYCRFAHDEPESDTAWDRWAWNLVQSLLADPGASWSVILDLVAAADDEALGLVAAGPLEEWICAYATEHIGRIEHEAQRSERFREALGGAWVWSSLPSTTFQRVARAARSALDAPASIDEASERRARRARLNELSALVDDETLDEQARAAADAETERLLGFDPD